MLGVQRISLLLQGQTHLLQSQDLSLLLLGRHLHLLVVDALLDDGVDLLERCPRVVLKQDLLLPLNPLLLLLA